MRIYKIKVNGKTYEVKVMGITETEPVEVKSEKVAVEKAPAAPAAPAPVASTPSEGKTVPAPMQGTILDLKVKVGDAVKAGDTLLILEAMKLENEIKSPTDGKVLSIAVSKGQSVSMNETLLILG